MGSRKATFRRPSRRRWRGLLILLVLAGLIAADRAGWLLVSPGDDWNTYHGKTVLVTRVIDGDTIEVNIPDSSNHSLSTRVRLWGIDCPELGRFGDTDEPMAQEATDQARKLVEGIYIMLRLEPNRLRGEYDRLLAHIELPDGTLLNRKLLVQGLAIEVDRWPHSRLLEYEQAELIARRAGLGIWRKME